MSNKYFVVTCKCGHVGKRKYVLINFPIKAPNKKMACEIAKSAPRVKHDARDCIRKIKEISETEFFELKKINSEDPYLKCTSNYDQAMIDMTGRIHEMKRIHHKKWKIDMNYENYRKLFKNKETKNYKKYINNYLNAGGMYRYEEFIRIGL